MFRFLVILNLILLTTASPVAGQDTKQAKDAADWLARVRKKLADAPTAEWKVSYEVVKPARKAPDEGFFYFGKSYVGIVAAGKVDFHFRVKGASQVHWREEWSKKKGMARDVFCEGKTICFGPKPQRIESLVWNQPQGDLIKIHFLEGGGVLGWQLGFGPLSAKWVGEEKVGGRETVVLDLHFGMSCCRAAEVGVSRTWFDRKTLLPIKRETRLQGELAPEYCMQANEVYSNWQFGQREDSSAK